MKTLIYTDADHCQWLTRMIGFDSITDIEEFIQYPGPKSAIFHIPYPYETEGAFFEQRILRIIDQCDKIAICGSELHRITVDFIYRFQNPKIKYFLCGAVENIKSSQWMSWFITTSHFYKTNPILTQLTPYEVKPKFFDILLGQPKPHRDVAYDYIINHDLQDQVIMTYLGHPRSIIPGENNPGWIWEDDGLELIETNIKWTVTQVRYYGQQMSLSQVVPIKIYNQTAYTVVCETNFDNHYSFYTEKIVKPILARRLFIVFSGKHYLKNLRNLGFKTFDGIIDESYDDVEDDRQRYNSALAQIQYLINQPQEEILTKIKHITEHNKQVMLTTNWLGDYLKEFQEFLLDRTN
jgi:hypothetical protein